MHDLTTTLQVLTEYTSGVMLLALTFYCWHLDRRGRPTKTRKAASVALCCLLLQFTPLPLTCVPNLPSYFSEVPAAATWWVMPAAHARPNPKLAVRRPFRGRAVPPHAASTTA